MRIDPKLVKQWQIETGIQTAGGAVKAVLFKNLPKTEKREMDDLINQDDGQIKAMSASELEKAEHSIIVHGAYGQKNLWETIGRISGGTPSRWEMIKLIKINAAIESKTRDITYEQALNEPLIQGAMYLRTGTQQAMENRHLKEIGV